MKSPKSPHRKVYETSCLGKAPKKRRSHERFRRTPESSCLGRAGESKGVAAGVRELEHRELLTVDVEIRNMNTVCLEMGVHGLDALGAQHWANRALFRVWEPRCAAAFKVDMKVTGTAHVTRFAGTAIFKPQDIDIKGNRLVQINHVDIDGVYGDRLHLRDPAGSMGVESLFAHYKTFR